MTVSRSASFALLAVLGIVPAADAQQPPRPTETPRGVTLTLAEYNRLIDLSSRTPQPPAPPMPAVLAAADLTVRVDNDTARGAFSVRGETFRNGVDRVHLLSGSTLIAATTPGRP